MKFNREDMSESKWFGFLQKYWLYIVVVIAVIIVAVSSINIYREEVLEIDPDVKMEEQNTLSFASAYIDTLNPIVSKSEDTYYISKLIYNSLFDYTADLNVEGELAESYGAQLVGVDSMDQSIQLLESGRADVTLNSETAFGDYLKKHPDAPVKIAARSETTTSSVIPVRKGSTALLEAIDEALDALRDSGELSALSQRYFGMDVTQE